MTKLTHRRSTNALSNLPVIQFAETGNDHFGEHVWVLGTELDYVADCMETLLPLYIAYIAETQGVEISEDAAEAELNPESIIISAGAWDDLDWVVWAYEHGHDAIGYETADGAIVLDADAVEMTYHKDAN